ncbi:sensor histidine kinase [Taibaiella lutea]|uniref:histidine kinase n=1 Tax=Taibaiella lutea TaxID=2608001 RepID=A0A5M6CIS0_9BACT|nr:sensor histidine kinase [Taibaiella lutea]KAA5535108.1 sensor histidine kinase [Taibaiella lutea]
MLQDIQNEIVIYYLAGTLVIILLVSAIIFYVFQHQKKVNAFRLQLQQEEIKRQQAIYAALQEGEEKERNRIAEELHDGISAKLSGLNMNLEYLIAGNAEKETRELLRKTFDGISETIDELREVSHNLQPLFFDEKDMQQLLQRYIEQLNSKNECNYKLYYEANLREIDRAVKLHSYRIVTELLHNVHKHAKATQASVQVIRDDDKLEIIVEDNGIGFKNTDTFNGIGLANIRNRVMLNMGLINMDTSDKGTTIIVELPL